MGRPEPCVLFSHSFVHAQLDEYVDEVLFAGPVVVTGCEFLEQNASPSVPAVSLVGATSPPSFALEVFVHCEGESRFRRLCQPFLYSPSSSNVLEVEVKSCSYDVLKDVCMIWELFLYWKKFTNHLIVRGNYRSLSLVIYGNTAEDLGQFNIDVDMDSSLANLVYSSSEGKIEDLPPPLRSMKLPLEDSISSLKSLSLPVPVSNLSADMEEFLQLVFKICQIPDLADALCKVVSAVVSLISSYVSGGFGSAMTICRQKFGDATEWRKNPQHASNALTDARDELRALYENHLLSIESKQSKLFENEVPEAKSMSTNSELLVYLFGQCFPFYEESNTHGHLLLSQRFKVLLLLPYFFFALLNKPLGMPLDVKLFLDGGHKQRHDIASLTTYILHRLRSYEIASAILSLLTNLSVDSLGATDRIHSLVTANSMLKSISKLLNLRVPVEDPSPAALVKSSAQGQEELLSYRATVDFISLSKHSLWDIDAQLLTLLKERGFLPLSAALLSSSILRLGSGSTMEIFMDIAASIELVLLTLLGCRSGLTFLLLQPEATAALVSSLQGFEDSDKAEYVTIRHAAVLISKGFFCRPQEIGMIAELHLRVGITIDRLLSSPPHSEEQLWTLWELCAISRSDSGRQALLSIGQFPEVVSVLIQILRSFKDMEPVGVNAGSSSLSLAIFHSAAEIIEVIIMDSNATSLASWIGLAADLHRALHTSSPGFNKKDAPTRVLEWIDAGVVYHKNGATGLLRYAAVLASGGDAGNVLVSDSVDIENVVGDSGSGSDSLFVDNLLGKFVSDKSFDGVVLHNMSMVQLTTAFRILAFVSENSTVAALLFEEGAVTLVCMILMNCRFILERSSNTFAFIVKKTVERFLGAIIVGSLHHYLVDEGTECGSTSDLLLEQILEQSVVELMIPCLVLLINLLQTLQEAKEQYRNTKLLKALLRLHRELSPKLAACAAELSFQYRTSALSLCTVCRLIASALACWPIFGWTPGLFHCLLESIQASSSLALGPKDACSFLCLLGDLFPEEGIWLWRNGMPSLSAIRTLSVGTILGPEGEKFIEWHLQPEHLTVLLGRLTPQLNKIAQIVLHFGSTDMLRVFIIRISCQRAECAVLLLEPIISWINDHIKGITGQSETDLFKMYRLLEFVASLLEHPYAKALLLKMGIMKILKQVLEQCDEAYILEEKLVSENRIPVKSSENILNFCMPSFKSLALIFDSRETKPNACLYDETSIESTSTQDCSRIMLLILRLCKALPVGRELLGCLLSFKELVSSTKGRSALSSIFLQTPSPGTREQIEKENGSNLPDIFDWGSSPPFLVCWRKLLGALHIEDNASTYAVESIHLLSLSGLCICMEGKNLEGISALKSLFGLSSDKDGAVASVESLKDLHKMISVLDQRTSEDELVASSTIKVLCQVKEAVKSMVFLLQKPESSSFKVEGLVPCEDSASMDAVLSPVVTPSSPSVPFSRTSDLAKTSSHYAHVLRSSGDYENGIYNSFVGAHSERFVWECPDTAPDRLMMPSVPTKRKLASSEGSTRRSRDSSLPEAVGSNGFPRGVGSMSSSSVPTRRDTFRQRKPNTSRPPSMHVDDYVARERNTDGAVSGANVASSQRGGMSSGRPPSIHVDEFMARQRERQNSSPATVGDVVQGKNVVLMNGNESEKADKSQKFKADLDDDHEINIVFDDESESDDKLPFPQPDDNLLPAPVMIGAGSPGSIVEENESEVNENNARISQITTPHRSDIGNSDLEVHLRRRHISQMEASMSSEKNYPRSMKQKTFFQEQSSDSKYVAPTSKGFDNTPQTSVNAFPQFYNISHSQSSGQSLGDTQLSQATFYPRDSPQKGGSASSSTGPQGYHENKSLISQPPLPPTPPPTISSMPLQTAQSVQSYASGRDVQPPLPSGFPLQGFDINGPGSVSVPNFQVYSEKLSSIAANNSTPSTAQSAVDSRYSVPASNKLNADSYASSSSTRTLPPLPTTLPPFSSSLTQSSIMHPGPQPSVYTQATQLSLSSTPGIFSASGGSLTTYSLPPFTPWQAPISGSLFSSVNMQPSQNQPALSQQITGQSSVQSVQPRPPPPPPPQAPRPSHPQQQSRAGVQFSQLPSEQVLSLRSPIQVQVQPLQSQQQLQIPQLLYYQSQQQEKIMLPPQTSLEQPQPQNLLSQSDSKLQQQDPGISLQHYFSTPEAIESLLNDREKLCQILEQHPKLVQMLQPFQLQILHFHPRFHRMKFLFFIERLLFPNVQERLGQI
ncbi:unnamed protein product [Spirodela intermedia]|uniref:Uncharacterized protein n=1 Tax=Spirodela intermedia TaxID=51605 RepID=A0A7I8L722_SPIIN|nr:unnamed protein product [Spirodela intermedia]